MVDINLCCRNPYEERTAHAYHVYSGTGHGSWGYSGMVSWSTCGDTRRDNTCYTWLCDTPTHSQDTAEMRTRSWWRLMALLRVTRILSFNNPSSSCHHASCLHVNHLTWYHKSDYILCNDWIVMSINMKSTFYCIWKPCLHNSNLLQKPNIR